MEKRITIKDIAKKQVSFKTVSRIINNEKNVSEQMKAKVMPCLRNITLSKP